MILHFYGRTMTGWTLLSFLLRPWKWRWLFAPPPGYQPGNVSKPLVINRGRTMKAEEAIEMWRKQGISEHEIKLRNFVVSLLLDEQGRPLSTRRPPPELR